MQSKMETSIESGLSGVTKCQQASSLARWLENAVEDVRDRGEGGTRMIEQPPVKND